MVLVVTREMMAKEKPDPRPHLLVTLLLHTGIKKQECMGLKLSHIDTYNPKEPVVQIRYANPRMQHKERRLRLPAEWTHTLAVYRRIYEPKETLFPCTARRSGSWRSEGSVHRISITASLIGACS